ncbi:MAG: cytochrome c3 family protein [Nitrospirota bacterium]
MKKALVITFLILLSVALISGSAYAVTGVCSNCHTMHYSQNGTRLSDWGTGGPYGYLLLDGCVGCHSGATGSSTNTHGAPIVLRTSGGAPSGQGGGKTLAGGDFYWVATGLGATDSKGHNVNGLAGVDAAIGRTPPGWDPNATPGQLNDGQINSGAATWSTQLTCAGLYGCHGNHTGATGDAGILGSHHSNTGGTSTQANNPTSVGGSYRFLSGINGLENSQWNWGETASTHNEYYGVDVNTDYGNKRTISYSCAECHGVFHKNPSGTGASSPWLRHPTDIDLPNGEYQSYNPDGLPAGSGAVAGNTDYSVEAPVGRTTVPASSSKDVTPSGNTDDIVLCLSCHRAHGSPEPDILRWTYSGQIAGSGTVDDGCFTCHTAKNGD